MRLDTFPKVEESENTNLKSQSTQNAITVACGMWGRIFGDLCAVLFTLKSQYCWQGEWKY
jgi:hypothetical protein